MRIKNKTAYNAIMARIDKLVEMVDDNTLSTDKHYIELDSLTDLIVAYEKEHFSIGKPTLISEPCKLHTHHQ